MTRLLATTLSVALSGCAQSGVIIQLYDAGGQAAVGKAVEDFAAARDVELQRPPVAPASTDAEVAVVYGSHWQAASMALALAERLDDLGFAASLVPTRLKNHVVTARHVGVFTRQRAGAATDQAEPVAERISQLICSADSGDEAIILLFGDGTLEIQTYVWDGAAVSGANHFGTWRAADKTLTLETRGNEIRYEASGCLPLPGRRTPCRTDVQWVSGGSIPALEGCSARNIVVTGEL